MKICSKKVTIFLSEKEKRLKNTDEMKIYNKIKIHERIGFFIM